MNNDDTIALRVKMGFATFLITQHSRKLTERPINARFINQRERLAMNGKNTAWKTTMIPIPNWVIKNLDNFGNCALPNNLMKHSILGLEKALERKTGIKTKIRKAKFPIYDKFGNVERYDDYLIAEEVR